jgi:hypothetical protein
MGLRAGIQMSALLVTAIRLRRLIHELADSSTAHDVNRVVGTWQVLINRAIR